jgi:hypothetical protein
MTSRCRGSRLTTCAGSWPVSKQAIVCDTTMLLYLGRIGQADLLSELFSPIYVPEPVMLELDMGRLLRSDTINPRNLAWATPVLVAQAMIDALPPAPPARVPGHQERAGAAGILEHRRRCAAVRRDVQACQDQGIHVGRPIHYVGGQPQHTALGRACGGHHLQALAGVSPGDLRSVGYRTAFARPPICCRRFRASAYCSLSPAHSLKRSQGKSSHS